MVSSSVEAVGTPGWVDGLLVVGSPERISLDTQNRLPVIFVNGAMAVRPNMTSWRDADGMYAAVRHLIDLGHRQIAGLFCYGKEPPADTPKVVGFRRAIEEADVECRAYWRGQDPFRVRRTNQFDNGYAATCDLLADWDSCTGIVARNDFIALGALRALREAGKSVPRDVSVVGYTDSVQAACADPPLASVRTPIAATGAMPVARLVDAISGRAACQDGASLPVELIVRSSTALAGPVR